MYSSTGEEQKTAQEVLTTLKEHPDSWTKVSYQEDLQVRGVFRNLSGGAYFFPREAHEFPWETIDFTVPGAEPL